MQKLTLERLLNDSQAQPQKNPDLSQKQLKAIEKQCLAVMGQCMEIMTLGGPQLEDLLRTAEDRSASTQIYSASNLTLLIKSSSVKIKSCLQLLRVLELQKGCGAESNFA